jgi:HSP20 family protein
MAKKTPWWRKPNKDEESNEDLDEEAREYYEKRDKVKRARDSSFGDNVEDWSSRRRRALSSPFDDDFNSIFRSPFGQKDSLFTDIERDMAEMHERMDKMFQQAMEGKLEKPGAGGPFVYGISMRTGPDGVPHIQEFGNMPPEMRERMNPPRRLPLTGVGELDSSSSGVCSDDSENQGFQSRKPLTDIMECDDHLKITMELPGIEKKDIKLEIVDNKLEVNVDTPVRKYHNRLPLPTEVDPNSISANFKNGVLDVNVKPVIPKAKKGKRIKIE